MFRFCIVLHSANNSEVQLFRSKKCKYCPLWVNTNTVERTSKLLQKKRKASPHFFQICAHFHLISSRCETVLLPAPGKIVQWLDGKMLVIHWHSILGSAARCNQRCCCTALSSAKHSSSLYGSETLCNFWACSNNTNSIQPASLICGSEEIHKTHHTFGVLMMALQGLCSNQIWHLERQTVHRQCKEQYKLFVTLF